MSFEDMTVAQLKTYCKENDIPTEGCSTKSDYIESIRLVENDPDEVIVANICGADVSFKRKRVSDMRMAGAITEIQSKDANKQVHGITWFFRILFGDDWCDVLDRVAEANDGMSDEVMNKFIDGMFEAANLKNS